MSDLKPIRCICRRSPLLAKYGITERGKPFVHVMVYKSNRLYAEILVESGVCKIRCRECKQWFRVVIKGKDRPKLFHQHPPSLTSSEPEPSLPADDPEQ